MDQRSWDIMQLEAKLKMDKLFAEWKQSFLGSRAVPQQVAETSPPPPTEEETISEGY